MNNDQKTTTTTRFDEVSTLAETAPEQTPSSRSRWRKRGAVVLLMAGMSATVPTLAHGQFLSVFDSIFSSIQDDMGASLKTINQISQQVQQLYQTMVWPLAALNQARGFVSNSMNTFRSSMSQAFNTQFTSATTSGPQQFETLLHSRQSLQIPALQTSFTLNYGAVPQTGAASPQDRVLMDMDDALGQENLKTTVVTDQAADVILATADQMENQVAVSTPGSNPFITAQAQVVNLRCQAYMQKMLAAELRQEAGRVAHQNVLVKRKSTATGNINSLVNGALTAR